MRRQVCVQFVGALVALSFASASGAHGGAGASGLQSTVVSVRPSPPGLDVTVRDFDDRLRLVNNTGRIVVIKGYEGEPYLEFRADGVYQNERSPATYLNGERLGGVEVPAKAKNPNAPPEWAKVADGSRFEWHDHRIHWMSSTLPPVVRRDPSSAHRVFSWVVPGTIGAVPLRIAGTLDYVPTDDGGFPIILVIPLIVLLLLTAVVWRVRTRARRARTS